MDEIVKFGVEMPEKKKYRTVVVSDVHMGAPHSKVSELTDYLSNVDCKRLILCGDIIDGWQIRKRDVRWSKDEAKFFKLLMRYVQNGTEVVYITGNHDDFLDDIVPCELFGMRIVSAYRFHSGSHEVVALHGHAFDMITTQFVWLSKLGDRAYNLMIRLNKVWNRNRAETGIGYYSVSKVLKDKVKRVVNIISGFEKDLSNFAHRRGCDIVICGHIHHACDKMIGKEKDVRYLNSGDWVESLTALSEDEDGNWKVEEYRKQ